VAELRGERVTLVPLHPDHAARLRQIREEPAVERWWGPNEPDFPLGDEPTAIRHAVLLDGEVIGMIQYTEEPEPDHRHAEIDVFLAGGCHGGGLGGDALRTLIGHLAEERGHHRITIAAEVENHAARRCYEKVGFEPIGVARKASRNRSTGLWEDEVAYDLLPKMPRLQLEELTVASFRPHLGKEFTLRFEPDDLEFTLTEAHGESRPFTVQFRGPADPVLPQAIYRLEREGLGALEIFIVPIAREEGGTDYEAVFS
jgi:aminoglycoside 6'-N-acetyltransferase